MSYFLDVNMYHFAGLIVYVIEIHINLFSEQGHVCDNKNENCCTFSGGTFIMAPDPRPINNGSVDSLV